MTPDQSICKKNHKVTLPKTHDTVTNVFRTLTRSVVVICLAQFFALIPRQLYRDRELSNFYKLNMAALPG